MLTVCLFLIFCNRRQSGIIKSFQYEGGEAMYFVIYKATNGQYYFVIKADNREVVATSETYYYKETAQRTIESIKRGVNVDSIVLDLTK